MADKISDLRRTYKRDILSENHLHEDPLVLFQAWFDQAKEAGILEPNVMTLATATRDGIPSARVLLLKGVDERGFVFFTNYNSDKGKVIAENPQGTMVFFWDMVEKQVRIDGMLEKISRKESETYFHSRPRESQIGAWTSPQSKVIASRAYLENRYRELTEKYGDNDVIPIPNHWGGYVLRPTAIEFWQGRPGRLHDRFLYTLKGKKWEVKRLAP